MAKTAVNQLQEQIEAIRREAFAAGFEAAMRSVRQFASTETPDTRPRSAEPVRRGASRRMRRAESLPQPGTTANTSRRGAAAAGRLQRGTNAQLVEEVLRSNASRALRPAEIRSTIQREKGMAIAFTSIRHALGQLESRGVVEQVADSNMWRCRGSASDSFSEVGGEEVAAPAE
jgi:hypothetical protein